MPYNRRYKKRRGRKKAPYKRKMNYNRLIKTIKRVDTRQEFKRAPTLRIEKSFVPVISPVDIAYTYAVCQAPYQDLPLQVGLLDKSQRLSSFIYPQVLISNGTLTRKSGDTSIQRFRVMVIRYTGEMDFEINNSTLNGWDFFNNQWSHLCRPGEVWSSKPYIKNQIKVLYDKEYVVNDTNKTGLVYNIRVPIKRKMTFETVTSGATAVGAGNVFVAITSDNDFNLSNYKTYAFYKDLQ